MQKDLSVQVHPNDEFASIYERGELGKQSVGILLIVKKMRK